MHLFPSLFDIRFHPEAVGGDLQGLPGQPGSLRQQSIRLAIHLLQEKIQLLANLASLIEQAEKLLDMAFETNQLLGNVAAICEQSRFLQNALRFELRTDEFLDSSIQLLRVGAKRGLAG